MHADELKVRVELPKCGDEGCDCADLADSIEGTIQEVLQGVYDDTIERDKNIMQIVTDQAETIVALYQIVQRLAPSQVQVLHVDDFGNSGKLN